MSHNRYTEKPNLPIIEGVSHTFRISPHNICCVLPWVRWGGVGGVYACAGGKVRTALPLSISVELSALTLDLALAKNYPP